MQANAVDKILDMSRYRSSTILIYNEKRELVLSETTSLAFDMETNTIRFVGKEAEQLDRSACDNQKLVIGSPFRNGVVANFDIAAGLIAIYLRKIKKYSSFIRPKIAVCVPIRLTDVEQRAFTECMYKAGAKKVMILESEYAKTMSDIPLEYTAIIEIIPEI